jgi:hypothetical protein
MFHEPKRYIVTQPRSHSCRSLHQDLLTPWPEELKGSSLLSGVSTHSNLPRSDLPHFAYRRICCRDFASPTLASRSLRIPETRYPWSTLTFLGVSGPRAIAAHALYLRVPKSRDPRRRDVDYSFPRLSLARYSQD